MSNYVPFVIEKTGRGERSYDIFSRLLADRIIFIGCPINDSVASSVIAQLLFLQRESSEQDVEIYINSPGGVISSGLAIYDTMRFLDCEVQTYCMGQAASISALLLAAGTKGKRYALPNSRILIHQPWGGTEGTATDISIQAEEILRLRENVISIISEHTGQKLEKIREDSDRDFFMDAKSALAYGIIDEVVEPSEKEEE